MIEYFDEEGIIGPGGSIVHEKELRALGATTAITAFSDHIFDELVNKYGAVRVAYASGGMSFPIYALDTGNKYILVYRSAVGAPASVSAAEEIFSAGINNLVVFGICGAIADIPPRTFIVPDRAYRDDGTSYHYMPNSEYVDVKNADVVDKFLTDRGMATLKGGVWTTDAFYRETRTRRDQMRENGCIAVDMECSALQALCNFRKKNFYTFFITADSLAGEQWEPNYILDIKVTDPDIAGVAAAVKLASEL